MGFPAQLDRNNLKFPDDDSVSHYWARELQVFLRISVVLSIIATVVMMATFWFFAWVPLLALIASIAGLFFVVPLERRTRQVDYERAAQQHRTDRAHSLSPDADTPLEGQMLARDREHFIPWKLFVKESVLGVEILIGLGLGALALAVVLVINDIIPDDAFFLVVGLGMTYALLVLAPIWLGWFTDLEAVDAGESSNEHVPEPGKTRVKS